MKKAILQIIGELDLLGAGQLLFSELYLLINIAFLLLYLTVYAGRYTHTGFFFIAHVGITFYLIFAYYFSLIQINFIHYYNGQFKYLGDRVVWLFDDYLVITDYVCFFRTLILFVAFICCVISIHYYELTQPRLFEYPLLLGISVVGCSFLLASFDLISFYLSMELTSFCLYALAASRYNSIYSVEAGIKYFVAGSAASLLYLFGSSIFFLVSSGTRFYDVSASLMHFFVDSLFYYSCDYLEIFFFSFAITFTMVLPLFKVAVFPFHLWIADVYEGAPMPITAYFSIVVKLTMSATLIRFLLTAFEPVLIYLNWCFLILGVFTVVVGTLAALMEQKIKRVLAFSSISHSGYILLGLLPYTPTAITASLNYLVIYIVTNIIIFTFLLFCTTKKESDNQRHIVFISDLALVQREDFFSSGCFAIALLSFAGIPPFAGFFAKFNIFSELWFAGYVNTVLILIVMSLISTFYYLRFIKCLFFSPNKKTVFITQSYENWVVLCVPTFFLILYPFFAYYLNLFLLTLTFHMVGSTLFVYS